MVPLWLPAALVAGFGLLGFFGLRLSLDHQTEQRMAAYNQVVQMPQRTAHITITLP
ncbi:transmembrane protein [Xanthomonas fragariae]|uniref:Transmembrane protein n=1 Tax=Xanthomonas fragariae TaxID=48664 RepID=A0A1Y6HIN5_9XANT|nr:hypothetical protein PD885_02092 [Xanthomonas fragariae]SMR03364.1 transmembrane protein [Xanthomonas fragariae]